jgi:enamine deaminase RidA (YjgF/YER057c/UK114 family)
VTEQQRPAPIDTGIAHRIGRYADAVVVPAGCDQIFVSGTPGLRADGSQPADFAEEAAQAWRNVAAALAEAGAGLADIVSVRQWLTSADDIPAYVAVRKDFIEHEPASMLGVLPGLVWPQLRIEVEVTAVRPAGGGS